MAIREARRQPWHGEEIRLLYEISDAVRHGYRTAAQLRREITRSGETPEVWRLAVQAADLERQADWFAHELDEALR